MQAKPTSQRRVRAIKVAVRERDGMRCTKCGLTNTEHLDQFAVSLHVHRLVPGSRYTVAGCVTLCGPCHGRAARRRKGELDVEVGDRHKPSRMTRVRPRLAAQLDILVERRDSDFAEQVNLAIRLMLEAEGLWPVGGKPDDDAEEDPDA